MSGSNSDFDSDENMSGSSGNESESDASSTDGGGGVGGGETAAKAAAAPLLDVEKALHAKYDRHLKRKRKPLHHTDIGEAFMASGRTIRQEIVWQ
jgi:hypothetical protein